jgi:hypothetical protein
MFDDFFNIGPMMSGPSGRLNIEIVPIEDPGIAVTNISDVTPKALNDRVKNTSNETEMEKLEDKNIDITRDKEIEKLENKSIELDEPTKPVTPKAITKYAGLGYGYILKYACYALILLIGLAGLLACFLKITSRDKQEDSKHTINDIEDELRGIKDKNKLY